MNHCFFQQVPTSCKEHLQKRTTWYMLTRMPSGFKKIASKIDNGNIASLAEVLFEFKSLLANFSAKPRVRISGMNISVLNRQSIIVLALSIRVPAKIMSLVILNEKRALLPKNITLLNQLGFYFPCNSVNSPKNYLLSNELFS